MKIIGFAGSLRSASYNKMALKLVLEKAEEDGAETEFIDLKPLNIPLYDGDLEKEIQLPDGIKLLREKIEAADGLIIATPEYNHSLPGVLKNTLDWISRTKYFPDILTGKKVALFGASDGNFATVRAQIAFFPIANTLGLNLMPSKTYVGNVEEVFDENGKCLDAKVEERLAKFAQNFVKFIQN
ncbi:MAG: NADPH-dependent FMN reductase [bacterium]|nr:NADPH-dependent FMN reductase [bacterium]